TRITAINSSSHRHTLSLFFYLLCTHLPPRSTFFPYTTLFRSYENIAPGDAIFFDWDLDGSADHVGIVIGTDGSRVYMVCAAVQRSEEHTSELQSRFDLVCRLLLEQKKMDAHSRSDKQSMVPSI